MKRICILYNHDLHFQTRILRQAETLLDAGYEVTVLCLAENKSRPCEDRRGKLLIRRILKKRLFKYHMFSFRMVKTLLKIVFTQPRADVVHVIDAPPLLLGWLLSRLWGARLVYDAAELWDALFDEEKARLIQNQSFSKSVRQSKLKQLEQSRRFEGWVLSRCDGVISVCDSIGELLKQKASRPIARYITLRNIARYEQINNSQRIREYFQLSDSQRVVVYQGQIAEKRGLGKAIDAVEQLEDIAFVMIGPVLPADQPFFDNLQRRIEQSEKLQGRVFYRGFIPSNELLQWTASADLGLQPIINWNMNHYLCLPNKLFEYVQANLPIAASHFPEMKNVIESYQIGFVFDPENPTEMAEKIRRFFDSPEQQTEYRQNLQRAKQELNWENEEKRLVELYQAVLPIA